MIDYTAILFSESYMFLLFIFMGLILNVKNPITLNIYNSASRTPIELHAPTCSRDHAFGLRNGVLVALMALYGRVYECGVYMSEDVLQLEWFRSLL